MRAGLDPSNEGGRTQVRRYLEERTLAIGTAGAGQLAAMLDMPGQTGTIFRERGLSSDTTLTIDFGIERALQALASDGVMRSGAIRRVAIVGPETARPATRWRPTPRNRKRPSSPVVAVCGRPGTWSACSTGINIRGAQEPPLSRAWARAARYSARSSSPRPVT